MKKETDRQTNANTHTCARPRTLSETLEGHVQEELLLKVLRKGGQGAGAGMDEVLGEGWTR